MYIFVYLRVYTERLREQGVIHMRSVSVRTLRSNLASVLDAVKSGTPVKVTRVNLDVAVIVPADWYRAALLKVAAPRGPEA